MASSVSQMPTPGKSVAVKSEQDIQSELRAFLTISYTVQSSLTAFRLSPILVGSLLLQRWRKTQSLFRALDGTKMKMAFCVAAAAIKFVFSEWRTRPKNVPFISTAATARVFAEAFIRHESNGVFQKFMDMVGRPTFALKAPGLGNIVLTADPKNVEHFLKTNFENYVKGELVHERLEELLGNGIFSTDGQLWYHQRKSASPLFTTNNFKDHMLTTFVKSSQRFVDILDGPATRGEAMDMFNLFNRFTLDGIGEVGFGRNIGALENPENPVLQSFDAAQQSIMERFIMRSPYWKVERFFNAPAERTYKQHCATLDAYVHGVAREAWADSFSNTAQSPSARKSNLRARSDFLSLFIGEMKRNGCTSTVDALSTQDEKFLRDLIMSFLIAGRDTTAQALSWTFYLLAQHPTIEAHLHSEVVETLGDGPLTYEGINRLEYAQCVVNEVLRLYPSVPKNIKVAVNDDVLPDGTVIPAGCNIAHTPFVMGRSKAIWGEDAAEFKPERWIGRAFPDLYSYPVFHAGPRECLGRRMAYLEIKVCLAALLRQYHFKLSVHPSEVFYAESLTLPMATPLPMIATRR